MEATRPGPPGNQNSAVRRFSARWDVTTTPLRADQASNVAPTLSALRKKAISADIVVLCETVINGTLPDLRRRLFVLHDDHLIFTKFSRQITEECNLDFIR